MLTVLRSEEKKDLERRLRQEECYKIFMETVVDICEIPQDMWVLIFSHLNAREHILITRTCKLFYKYLINTPKYILINFFLD